MNEKIIKQILEAKLGKVNNILALNRSRNSVFKIAADSRNYLLKIYTQANHGHVEKLAYNLLRKTPYLKKLLLTETFDDCPYIVTEYAEGTLLSDGVDERKYSEIELNFIILQVINFIKTCNEVKLEKFGVINKDGKGCSENWYDWLNLYTCRLSERIEKLQDQHKSILKKHFLSLKDHLERNKYHLKTIEPSFTPVDVNLSNFLISDAKSLIVLDLESFWLADPLIAYGDWLGNTFLTPLGDTFINHWGELENIEKELVHIYALLSNLSALVYISEHQQNIFEAKPWGNTHKYFELIQKHEEVLSQKNNKQADVTHQSIRNNVNQFNVPKTLDWRVVNGRIFDILQIVRRFCNVEFNRDGEFFFAIIYGSYAYKLPQKTSDLDIMFVSENVTSSRIERVKNFVINLHQKYNMRRDDEIPYEKKVLVSKDFFIKSCNGDGIFCKGKWQIPTIKKTKEYLCSDELLLRFILGMMSNPHIFVDGDHKNYQKLRHIATWNLIKALVSINDIKHISAINLLEKFCKNNFGEFGDHYLGFSYQEPFKSYLAEYLETVLSDQGLQAEIGLNGAKYNFADVSLTVQSTYEIDETRNVLGNNEIKRRSI